MTEVDETERADVVDALRAKAQRHRRAGNQPSAISVLEQALREPVDDATRAALLLEIASAEARLDPLRGADRYRDALVFVDHPRARLDAALRRARCLATGGLVTDALEQVDAARREIDDPDLALRADLVYVALARNSLDTRPLGRARLARISSTLTPEQRDVPPQLLGELAYERVLAGDDHTRVVEAAMAALGGADLSLLHEISPHTRHVTLLALCWCGELRVAERAAQLVLARANRRGSAVDGAQANAILMNVEWARGDLLRVLDHADQVLTVARESMATLLPGPTGLRAAALAALGRTDEARAALELPGDERKWSSLAGFHGYLMTAAWTHLALGDHKEAYRVALRCGTFAGSMGTTNPGVLPWREAAAHAAAAMGMHDDAAALALEAVERARAFGAPASIATALRALAAVRRDDALSLLEEAQSATRNTANRLLRARIHVDVARVLARDGRVDDARREATGAIELADAVGAAPLTSEARALLAALESRPSSRRENTPPSTGGGHLHVLGGFSLTDGSGRPATPRGIPGKAVRVLAAAGGPLHLEQLADCLWDDAIAPDRTRMRLRNVIARTRIGDRPAICRDGDLVYLDPDITVDAVQFDQACARALAAPERDALEAAVAATLAYGGDLLPSDPYAEWATLPRERLRLRYLTICDRAARLAIAAGLTDLALDRLEAAIRHDPYDAERYRHAAEILTATGDTAGAAAMCERQRRVEAAFSR